MLPVNDSHVGSKSNAESLLWTGGREGRGRKKKKISSNAESLLWTGGSRKASASLSLSTGTVKEGEREMLGLLFGL